MISLMCPQISDTKFKIFSLLSSKNSEPNRPLEDPNPKLWWNHEK
jgi:hypothetical protein